MSDRDALLTAIVADPREDTRWLVLADWLEEFDDPRRAELLRLHRKLIATCCEPEKHPERAGWQSRMTELLVAGVLPCVPQRTLELPGGVPMTFAFIPPGAFLMGEREDEKPKRKKKAIQPTVIKKGFFLGTHLVTQAQWATVMETNPSSFKGGQLPVDSVSWTEGRRFCRRVSEHTGCKVKLPIEAEWEYACRAGTTTLYYCGDELGATLANYDARKGRKGTRKNKYPGRTTDVGSYPPNPWGLYDMHGNLWEWCEDKIDPEDDESTRIMRGGCWDALPHVCTSASRADSSPGSGGRYDGLRVCLRLN
jgi:uncharacterized protein (TIGR02996 family)